MNTIEEILQHCERLLLQCWQETGFGMMIIESERVQGNGRQIRIIFRGPTCYRFVIDDTTVHAWRPRRQ